MSNGLSQAEIDALMKSDPSEPSEAASANPAGDSDTMSPEEIAALLGDAPDPSGDPNQVMGDDEIAALLEGVEITPEMESEPAPAPASAPAPEIPSAAELDNVLSAQEKDALGEIGNISMGTAATTLFALLNHRVDITTPKVSVTTMKELGEKYPMPFVSVEVKYTSGLEGTNCLFLRTTDVKIITDLMMGGDGTNTDGDINEMHLSCIGEVMNQMVGASSTSLSQILKKPIDISPPQATQVTFNTQMGYPFTNPSDAVVRTAFDMVVEGLIQSEIMQITPVDFAKEMVTQLMGDMLGPDPAAATPPPPPPEAPAEQPAPGYHPVDYSPAAQAAAAAPPPPGTPPQQGMYGGQQPYPPPPYPYPPQPPGYPPYPQAAYAPPPPHPSSPPVDVHPAQFGSFGDTAAILGTGGENMDILLDVPLSVSVELGKSRKYIGDILDFNVGTIVVLDKMAGDLVDVMVNGKLIAQGEVVVIDDSYGCRITEIVSPSKRINPLK